MRKSLHRAETWGIRRDWQAGECVCVCVCVWWAGGGMFLQLGRQALAHLLISMPATMWACLKGWRIHSQQQSVRSNGKLCFLSPLVTVGKLAPGVLILQREWARSLFQLARFPFGAWLRSSLQCRLEQGCVCVLPSFLWTSYIVTPFHRQMHISVSGGARGSVQCVRLLSKLTVDQGGKKTEEMGWRLQVCKADRAGNVSARDALIELLPS